MAASIFYVRPEGLDTNDGLSWATARKTLNSVYNNLMVSGAPDVCYVSKRTVEAFNLIMDNGLRYVCLDDSQSPALVASVGATVTGSSLTAGNGSSQGYVEGFTFTPNTGTSFGLLGLRCRYKNCTFNNTNQASGGIALSTANIGSYTELIDCTINFNNSLQSIFTGAGKFYMRGGAVNSSAVQNNFLAGSTTPSGNSQHLDMTFDGVDFSGYDASTLLLALSRGSGRITFYRCKFKSSFSGVIAAAKMGAYGVEVYTIECDVAGSGPSYRYEVDSVDGELKARTSTYRVGGAQVNGFSISWDCNIRAGLFPLCFTTPQLVAYNSTTSGPITVTLEFLAAKANLTISECSMEVSYLADATSMKGVTATTEPASFVNGATLVQTSTALWVGTPTNYTAYKLTLTISPKQAGALIACVRANLVGNIIIDPKLTVA